MNGGEKQVEIQTLPVEDAVPRLRGFPTFAAFKASSLGGVPTVHLVRVPAGATLTASEQEPLYYWIVLDGAIRTERPEPDGSFAPVGTAQTGEGFGEIPLMHGKGTSPFRITADVDSELLRFSEEQFWNVLACCPTTRAVILRNANERIQAYQVEALHREKLISLGTLAAGLMHELHNPGSAAKRSAAQLRENLLKLQELSLRMSEQPKTAQQLQCIRTLLQHTVHTCRAKAMSSIEQADAEEAMAEWLAAAGVKNAYEIGPTLAAMGFHAEELRCAREYFEAPDFSDALNWLGALVSSMSHVCAIEESIGRISDLAAAVKEFAYDEKSPQKELDVHDSLQSTLTILSHKLRIKQIHVEKRFNASPATIATRGSALAQVWTNLIDNAADASPAGADIEIATWTEPEWLAVCIGDHGSGIPPEVLPHIFEAFFTTKPQGAGTGLGLEIAHRIVTQKFGGRIDVETKPGETRFIVRLPRGEQTPSRLRAESKIPA